MGLFGESQSLGMVLGTSDTVAALFLTQCLTRSHSAWTFPYNPQHHILKQLALPPLYSSNFTGEGMKIHRALTSHSGSGHPACPSDNLGGLSPNLVLYVLDTPTVSTLPAGNMEIFFIFA